MEVSTVKRAYDSSYFCCDNDVFDLPLRTVEKCIYLTIIRYTGTNKQAWPAYETMARDASCSKRRAIQAIKHLCACKLITKERRSNRTNNYLVNAPRCYSAPPEGEAAAAAQKAKKTGAAMPPEDDLPLYYHTRDEKDASREEKNFQEAPAAPARVNELHPRGEGTAPLEVNKLHPRDESAAHSGCRSCTIEVNELHPKSNMKSNSEKEHEKISLSRSVPVLKREGERENLNIKKRAEEKREELKAGEDQSGGKDLSAGEALAAAVVQEAKEALDAQKGLQGRRPLAAQADPGAREEFKPARSLAVKVEPKGTEREGLRVKEANEKAANEALQARGTLAAQVDFAPGEPLKARAEEITEEEIEAVRRAFRAKKAAVKDDVIRKMLLRYPLKDIRAAICECDFHLARNPLVVIRWMLANSCYLMPPETEVLAAAQEVAMPEVDYGEARQFLRAVRMKIMSN